MQIFPPPTQQFWQAATARRVGAWLMPLRPSAAGSAWLALPLDCGTDLFQRQIIEPLPAFLRVVAGAGTESVQQLQRFHDPYRRGVSGWYN